MCIIRRSPGCRPDNCKFAYSYRRLGATNVQLAEFFELAHHDWHLDRGRFGIRRCGVRTCAVDGSGRRSPACRQAGLPRKGQRRRSAAEIAGISEILERLEKWASDDGRDAPSQIAEIAGIGGRSAEQRPITQKSLSEIAEIRRAPIASRALPGPRHGGDSAEMFRLMAAMP